MEKKELFSELCEIKADTYYILQQCAKNQDGSRVASLIKIIKELEILTDPYSGWYDEGKPIEIDESKEVK